MAKYNVQEFAELIKTEYPDYAEMDDLELTKMVVSEYPEYEAEVDIETTTEPVEGDDKKEKTLKNQNKQLEDNYKIQQYTDLLEGNRDLAIKIVSKNLTPKERRETKKVRQQFKVDSYNKARKSFENKFSDFLIENRNVDLKIGAQDYIFEIDADGEYKEDVNGQPIKWSKDAVIDYLKNDEFSKLAGETLQTAEDYVQFMNTNKRRKKGDSTYVISADLPEAVVTTQGKEETKKPQDYLTEIIEYDNLFTQKEKDAAAILENLLPNDYVITETGVGNAIKVDLPNSGVKPITLKTRYKSDDVEDYMDQVQRLENYIKETNPNVTNWEQKIEGVTSRYIKLQNTPFNERDILQGGVALTNAQASKLDEEIENINVLPETIVTSEYRKSGQYTVEKTKDPYKTQRTYAESLLINQYKANPDTAPKPTQQAIINLTKQIIYDEREQGIISENFEKYVESGSSILRRGGILDKKAKKQAMFTAGSMVLASKENAAIRKAEFKANASITNLQNQQKIFDQKSSTKTVQDWLKKDSTEDYIIQEGQAYYTNDQGRKIPAYVYNEYVKD